MPLLDTLYYPDGTSVHLWRRTETIGELETACSRLELLPADAGVSRNDKRKGERLVEMLLLHRIFGRNVTFGHADSGAPRVDIAGCHISISHTPGWVCIARNDSHSIGVDIERCSEKILRVREKFLNSGELELVPAGDIPANALAWTAKEALYKLFEGRGGASLADCYSIGECVQVINKGYIVREAKAECVQGEPLTVISRVMSGAVLSLAVETKYLIHTIL